MFSLKIKKYFIKMKQHKVVNYFKILKHILYLKLYLDKYSANVLLY